MNTKARAAAYVRVSTDEQVEYSPDAQLRAIREFCKRNDYDLQDKHIYIDEGISGRSAAKRPAFQKMVSVAKLNAKSLSKDFDVIVVHKFDRFARSREDSVVYKSLLRRDCNIKVLSVTENIEDDKFSVILEAMLEAMAEYYSINLAEEVKKGMTEKALRGEPLTIAPFGYVMENKELVVDEEKSKIIKGVFSDFVNGQGYMQIAKRLNDLDIRTIRGGRFENRTIEYILRNPTYIGKIRWNPKRRTRRNYADSDLIVTQGTHAPIISEEVFLEAQERVAKIKEQFSKYSKAESSSHWLVGLTKCSSCGKGLVKNGTNYLQCRGYVGGMCNLSHLLNIEEAEKLIIKKMEEDGKGLSPISVSVAGKTNLDYLEKQLNTLERRLARAKESYAAGVDSLDEYKENKERISREIETIRTKQDNTPRQDTSTIDTNGIAKAASLLTSDLSMEDKKIVAHKAVHHIIYDKPSKSMHIVYNCT